MVQAHLTKLNPLDRGKAQERAVMTHSILPFLDYFLFLSFLVSQFDSTLRPCPSDSPMSSPMAVRNPRLVRYSEFLVSVVLAFRPRNSARLVMGLLFIPPPTFVGLENLCPTVSPTPHIFLFGYEPYIPLSGLLPDDTAFDARGCSGFLG
jgi:hypothetical protein